MLGEVLQFGDKVILTVPKENRDWGYNPYPDGTEAIFIRFSEIAKGWANFFGKEPGIYENGCYAYFLLKDGKEICEYTGRAEMVDDKAYEFRIKSFRDDYGVFRKADVKLRDLPETTFIEGDVVTGDFINSANNFTDNTAIIAQVHYENIGKFCNDGITPMPTYSLSPMENTWTLGIRYEDEETFQLVNRGNVWKFRHNEKIDWGSVEEHAKFLNSLGLAKEVRNPANKLFCWTKEEAVKALQDGLGDCICVGGSLFGSGNSTSVKRFEDRDIGEQIRQKTIDGFLN